MTGFGTLSALQGGKFAKVKRFFSRSVINFVEEV